MKSRTARARLRARLFSALTLLATSPIASAAITALIADRNTLFTQTPTPVRFAARIETDPKLLKTSVQLLREGNPGVFAVVGSLRDDGSNGDLVANDGFYTVLLTLNEPAIKDLRFQASAAYSGSPLRQKSGFFEVSVVPDVNLSVSAGEAEITVERGDNWSTAFTLQLQKKSTAPARLTALQVLAPSTGVTIETDLPALGWSTVLPSQSYLVQSRLTGETLGTYALTLRATLDVAGTVVVKEASMQVTVAPPGGLPAVALSISPGGLQVNTSEPVLFGAHFSGGSRIPKSVLLTEVTQAGSTVAELGLMTDDGLGADLSPADELYSLQSALTAGASPLDRYFRATVTFADGSQLRSAVERFPILPFPVSFNAPQETSLRTDRASAQQFYCDRLLVVFAPGTALAPVQAAAAAIGASIIGSEPAIDGYLFSIPCGTAAQVGAAILTLSRQPGVRGAEPDMPRESSQSVTVTPNDPYYFNQYALPLVRADEAWVLSRGGPVIAILDSGIDYHGTDFAGQVVVPNKCDVPPGVMVKLCPEFVAKNKVILGKDFVNNDSNPDDDHWHGTHVAGIAGAIADNFFGVAGMAWDSPLLAVKTCRPKVIDGVLKCSGSTSLSVSGIAYATTRAKIINMSYGGGWDAFSFCLFNCGGFEAAPSLIEFSAVDGAVSKGVLPVAAAGNNRNSVPQYPCSHTPVLCVGNSTSSDLRYFDSTFGPQVDIAAPGAGIYSSYPGFEYGIATGTSMSSPLVAGAAALVWGRHPTWSVSQVRNRLIKSAVALPGQQIGPRVDVFEAVFNGGFEDGLAGSRPKAKLSQGVIDDWFVDGTRSAVAKLGPISPTRGKLMGMLSTGPSSISESEMFQAFPVQQPGTTTVTLKFDYAMITEEYPEFVGRGFNDDVTITLEGPCAPTQPIALETVDGSTFFPIGGINFPDGDDTVGWTGWRPAQVQVPLTQACVDAMAENPLYFRLKVRDRGDGEYDTNMLIDNIRFK